MAKQTTSSAALPIARAALRFLIAANWLLGAAIVVLLVAMPTERWILSALHLAPSPEADAIVLGLRAIAMIGIVAVPLHYAILKRLLGIVESVRAGDPFLAANASRLQAIAWALLALQVLGLVVGAIVEGISAPAHPIDIDAGFSVSGWLAVLLTFLLARVFAEGTVMRDDLQGTV